MRTKQDLINRKEANQRYYKLEENKEQKRNYMKAYRKNNNWVGKFGDSLKSINTNKKRRTI